MRGSLGRGTKPSEPEVQRARPVGYGREEHGCTPPAVLLEQLELVLRRQVCDVALRRHKFVEYVCAERGDLQVERIDHMRQIELPCVIRARDLIALHYHHCLHA